MITLSCAEVLIFGSLCCRMTIVLEHKEGRKGDEERVKAQRPSKTAQYMALFRAIETVRPEGRALFRDHYARQFLSRPMKVAVSLSSLPIGRELIPWIIRQSAPGALSSGVARTRYIDDLVERTVREGATQIIILGAGYDTRALRLDSVKSAAVIEIDHPDTSRFKLRRLTSMKRGLPENVSYCEADFDRESLEEIGSASIIAFDAATTLVWEGVTNYLTSAAVDATFRWTERFPRINVIFTYLDKKVLDHPEEFAGARKLIKHLHDTGEQWTFGFAPYAVPAYLSRYSLTLIEDVSAADYRAKYMADRTPEIGYEFYRAAFARHETTKGAESPRNP